jgi:hypothetical protein
VRVRQAEAQSGGLEARRQFESATGGAFASPRRLRDLRQALAQGPLQQRLQGDPAVAVALEAETRGAPAFGVAEHGGVGARLGRAAGPDMGDRPVIGRR